MSGDVWFRLLGPVELAVGGEPRDLGSAKQRCLLAVLLLEPAGPVSTATLIDRIWGDAAPGEARNALYSYLARLRKSLYGTGTQLRRRAGGYVLDTGAARVDVREAAALTERGRLEEALDLWRGEPLAGLSGPWVRRVRAGLHRQRLTLLTRWADTAPPADVVARLRPVVDAFPLAEALIARFLRALHDTGRTGEALDRYRDTVLRLGEQLGAEPGAVLAAVYRDLTATRPAQLPAPPAGFVGRDRQLAELDELAGAGIVLVTGMAGVGKTALALTWAHRVRDRFPDGQLYLNLRGSSTVEPVRPGPALAAFLHALGVAPDRIPLDADAAAGLYRSLLATRRMLVVLDNAGSAAQVRPLLPGGSAGTVVVITSRHRLSSLIIDEGARRLRLTSLPDPDAVALLDHAVGSRRVAADPAVTAELIALCGRLPLALRIAAATLLAEPSRALADYVTSLRTATPLAVLAGTGDAAGGWRVGRYKGAIRGAFDLSYQRLDPLARRLFRLLSCHPGADFTAATSAALAGTDRVAAGRLLDLLAAAHLIEPGAGPRYALHDLLRQYAGERATAEETPDSRAAAARRLCDHYVHGTDRAVRLAAPALALPDPPPSTSDPWITAPDAETALPWLDAERTNLALLCATTEEPDVAWRLSGLLRGYFQLRAHDGDWLTVIDAGLASARRRGTAHALATAALSRGYLLRMRGPDSAAVSAFAEAARLAERAKWTVGLAAALSQLGLVYPRIGDSERGIDCLTRAIELARAERDAAIEGAAHGNLGSVCADRGLLNRALSHLTAELRLLERAPSRYREANAVGDIGLVLAALGDLPEAIDHHRRALILARDLGHRWLQANAHVNLAAACLELDRLPEAAAEATLALDLARTLRAGGIEAEALGVLATLHDRRGDPAAALPLHHDAVRAARSAGDPRAQIEVLTRLAERATNLSDVDAALSFARQHGFRVFEARCLRAAAEVHLAQGHRARAARSAHAALALSRESGHRPGQIRALATLARITGL